MSGARPARRRQPTSPRRRPKNLGRTLVVVELAGGNDGLSTLIPLADGRYHDLRPTLAVANPIELDGEVGLHPNLAKLGARYKAGQVAVVEGVGYPDPNLSHFASIADLVDGPPGRPRPAPAGWVVTSTARSAPTTRSPASSSAALARAGPGARSFAICDHRRDRAVAPDCRRGPTSPTTSLAGLDEAGPGQGRPAYA